MTSLTNSTSAHLGSSRVRVHAVIATVIERIRANRAARRAEALKNETDIKISGLDAHILRDIGLNPAHGVKRGRLSLDSRSDLYGF